MSLVITNTASDFTPAPGGWQSGVCCDVIDLGIVKSTGWGDKDKLKIVWMVHHRMEDGRPYVVSKRYNKILYR